MKKSQLVCYACLCFIIGISLGSLLKFDAFYSFLAVCAGATLTFIYWYYPNQKFKIIALGAVFLFLGLWRWQLAEPKINQNHIAYYNNQNLFFIGQVATEPDVRLNQTKLTMGNIFIGADDNASRRGKILVSVPNFPVYNYGDWLEISCELEQPDKIEDFDYGRYLAVKGIYTVCYRPTAVNRVETQNFTSLRFWQTIRKNILSFKHDYENIIIKSLVYPESELLLGLVLGLRRNIPEHVTIAFNRVGITHILAISGMNITIISGLLMNFLIAIGWRRNQAFYLAVAGILLFLLMLGWQSSAIRAGLMGFLVLLGMRLGRLNQILNSLLIAAVCLLLVNPSLLLSDIGFQLSFLAVLGIIYLGDPIAKLLAKFKVPAWFEIRSSLMMTLAAQVLVLPLLVYYFGNLSLIAPLANILILPIIPFLTIGGFILGLFGFIYLPLAHLLGLLLQIGLKWILLTAEILAKLPLASHSLGRINLAWILVVYILIGWGIWLLENRKKKII